MSTLETILSRMMSEYAFSEAVFANAEQALAEYNLPTLEIEKFKAMSRADFASFVSAPPEDRKSFSLIGSANGGVWKTTSFLER